MPADMLGERNPLRYGGMRPARKRGRIIFAMVAETQRPDDSIKKCFLRCRIIKLATLSRGASGRAFTNGLFKAQYKSWGRLRKAIGKRFLMKRGGVR